MHFHSGPPMHLLSGVDTDCAACVTGEVTWPNGTLEIYVQPHPINRRMSFHDEARSMTCGTARR